MSFKTILLPIRESEVAESLIRTAAGIASRQGAHLEGLYVHPQPRALVPYATLGLSRAMQSTIEQAALGGAKEQAERLRELFESGAAAHGLAVRPRAEVPGQPGAWLVETQGLRSHLIARHGRLSDLIVVPRPNRTSPPPGSFEAAVRETGRPVLMVPRGSAPQIIGRRVLIGWNASKEAARAVATALPYMTDSTVHVLCSTKRVHESPSAEALITYLACHGVKARLRVFDSSHADVGETLLGVARELDADLLVVGGYSRSRVREIVMGGVTGHLLEHAEVPVLLVH